MSLITVNPTLSSSFLETFPSNLLSYQKHFLRDLPSKHLYRKKCWLRGYIRIFWWKYQFFHRLKNKLNNPPLFKGKSSLGLRGLLLRKRFYITYIISYQSQQEKSMSEVGIILSTSARSPINPLQKTAHIEH